jgi:hypothetical protein
MDKDILAALAEHYASSLPGHVDQAAGEVDRRMAQFAGVKMPDLAGAIDLAKTGRAEFCKDWPEIKGFIEMAEHLLGFFSPGSSAKAAQFVKSMEAVALPVICPTTK